MARDKVFGQSDRGFWEWSAIPKPAPDSSLESELKFQGYLHNARIPGARHKSKRRALRDASRRVNGGAIDETVRTVELGMIEGIEGLEPELQSLGLSDGGVFQQGQVEIVEARPMEEAAVGVPQLAH